MRKGLIAELAPAAKAVKAANEQTERVARVNIEECVVGRGGPHIRGLTPTVDSIWAVARARLQGMTCAPPSRERAQSSGLRIAKFCIYYPGSLSSTTNRAYSTRGHGGRALGGGPAHRHLLRQRAAKHGDLRQPGGA